MEKISRKNWALIWVLGMAGQICWNIENSWFNTFVYRKIAPDPSIVAWMVGVSAVVSTFCTFLIGTASDRLGRRRPFIAFGYILWGVFTIGFGVTEFLPKDPLWLAATCVVLADAVMSFFGSMGNDGAFNPWTTDISSAGNRGKVGGALAVLSAFPAAALFWHDRRGCRAAVCARSVSSWKLVFCRYAALTAAMALPVAVMALTLTCVAAGDYGPANVDMLAYGKYALFWILPTIALSTAVGLLPAALTGLPLGPLLALLWGWRARSAPAFAYAALFAPRHEALGETARFLENVGALARGRVAAALLGLALCALAAFAVEWKRRGRGYALRFGRRAA